MSRTALTGLTAAVTGGGRGIGLATARALVGEGMRVAIGDLDEEAARHAAAEFGDSAVAFKLDVRDPDSFTRFLDQTEDALGPLAVLVNNAGLMSPGALADEEDAATRRMLEVNAYGVLLGSKLALPRMQARGGGRIVNVASVAGRIGFAGAATYCATKFFVMGLSEALRAELHGTGVQVSCVLPGVVDTELVSGFNVPRLAPSTQPDQVAAAVVRLLRTGAFAAYVPRSMGHVARATRLFPLGLSQAANRALGGDRVLFQTDLDARRAYDERIAREP